MGSEKTTSFLLSIGVASITVLSSCNPLSGGSATVAPNYRPGISRAPLSSPAGSANIYYGLQAYDSNGNILTGTMPIGASFAGANGSLTSAIPAGYYSGAQTCTMSDANLTAANIASGISVFGTTGTLAYGNLTGSNEFHNIIAAGDETEEQEIDQGTCSDTTYLTRVSCEANLGTWTPSAMPNTYRNVPDITKDDDGTTGGSVTYLSRAGWVAGTTCGTSGTITARIANCAANSTIGANATWDGTKSGNSGYGIWKLVTREGTAEEVWQDQRTKLLWSSRVSGGDNWCVAAGNVQANDPAGYCNNGANQNQATPTSYCAEDAGLSPALGAENWATGTYDLHKGGMGKNAATSVIWRLPSAHDYALAEVDGIRFVMPDMGSSSGGIYEWTSSINTGGLRSNAFLFGATVGSFYDSVFNTRTGSRGVRCVGR